MLLLFDDEEFDKSKTSISVPEKCVEFREKRQSKTYAQDDQSEAKYRSGIER